MSQWRISGGTLLATVVTVLLSAAGIMAIVFEAAPKEGSTEGNFWTLSGPLAALQTVSTVRNPLSGFEARVTAVASGSILIVVDADHRQHQVRLAGTATPALDEKYGRESRENLSKLALGKTINVTPLKTEKSTILAKALLEGTNLGLEQIRCGMARFDKQAAEDLGDTDRRLFAEMESYARAAGVGMWFGQRIDGTTAAAELPGKVRDFEVVPAASRVKSK